MIFDMPSPHKRVITLADSVHFERSFGYRYVTLAFRPPTYFDRDTVLDAPVDDGLEFTHHDRNLFSPWESWLVSTGNHTILWPNYSG